MQLQGLIKLSNFIAFSHIIWHQSILDSTCMFFLLEVKYWKRTFHPKWGPADKVFSTALNGTTGCNSFCF